MAKKGNRLKIGLSCSVCGSHNYVTERNKLNSTEALKLEKYCKICRKITPHKEKKKLH